MGAVGAVMVHRWCRALLSPPPNRLSVGVVVVLQPKKDMSRFVRWPHYIRLQRQKKILFQRLKVPPAVNVFRQPLDKAEGAFSHSQTTVYHVPLCVFVRPRIAGCFLEGVGRDAASAVVAASGSHVL